MKKVPYRGKCPRCKKALAKVEYITIGPIQYKCPYCGHLWTPPGMVGVFNKGRE